MPDDMLIAPRELAIQARGAVTAELGPPSAMEIACITPALHRRRPTTGALYDRAQDMSGRLECGAAERRQIW
jgi:hypothetical protein